MKKKKQEYAMLDTEDGEELLQNESTIPWMEYPRPQCKRASYTCLNGWWEFGTVEEGKKPAYTERIRVPFVPQSRLSGIGRYVPQSAVLCYRRTFSAPAHGERVILHIGAADQSAEVVLNGQRVGSHRGGYAPFSFDVTQYIKDQNELEIFVRDALDNEILPYGKQREARGGMWYTPVSGIWQTVWLECVPKTYITDLRVSTDTQGADITVILNDGTNACGEVTLGDQTYPLTDGHARITLDEPRLWSPEDPHLYEFSLCVGEDRVESYFALRTLAIKEIDGRARLFLNGKPYFFHGLLDQGYFSDGIFLPATPKGFEADIQAAKSCGFNMLRKHIKIEPSLFYYACDRLGMIVFQDMVNNGGYSFLRDTALPTVGFKSRNDKRLHRDKATRAAFLSEMKETVTRLSFHPCVCYWTIFNEGWGQFDHAAVYQQLKKLDSTRFIDSVSGWFMPRRAKELQSDVESVHIYFKPVRMKRQTEKPYVLSEFGGYSYRCEGHCYNLVGNYGYRSFGERADFEDALERLYTNEVLPAIREGLCAAVYTQLSDVEDETNGLLTYDRRVLKVSPARMQKIATALFEEMK